jgi:hypothetical protein
MLMYTALRRYVIVKIANQKIEMITVHETDGKVIPIHSK